MTTLNNCFQFLSLSAAARQATSAELTSHMTVDIHKVVGIISEVNIGFEVFLYTPAAATVMWQAIGPASLVGIVLLNLVFFLNGLGIRGCIQSLKARDLVILHLSLYSISFPHSSFPLIVSFINQETHVH